MVCRGHGSSAAGILRFGLGLARSTRDLAAIPRGAIAIRWVELTWATCADVYRD